MSMDSYDFTVGARVLTADGQDVGAVKEILGYYFKVDAPMAPDYWLPASLIRSSDQSVITLGADREALGGYEVEPSVIEDERVSEAAPPDEQTMAIEAAVIVWGADEWPVVRRRILEHDARYNEAELDRMQAEEPEETHRRFGHLFEDANRSAERLARTIEENT
ncbi:MAG: hypothetical protein K1X87_00050 [Dehalococcoidia bacterium]|nr:hypothetical protein [Dehalococcoidia bacterium]